MKKLLLTLSLTIGTAMASFAQLGADGFYRVQNVMTERYIVLIDDKGSIDIATSSADLGAIHTLRGFENVVSNPASVITIKKQGDGYNLIAQGTDAHKIIGYYLNIADQGSGKYRAYKSRGGMTVYLSDEYEDVAEGSVLTTGSRSRDWYIKPVTADGDCYFGILPEMTVGGKHYASMYASFAYQLPEGVKAYAVTLVDGDKAVYGEVENGVVPEATAIILECASDKAVDNKADLLAKSPAALTGNLLKGVYFKNGTKKHYNQVAYDAATMRVLGTMADGSLGLVTANYDYLPANRAYVTVPEGSPAELKLMSYEEYIAGVNFVNKEGHAAQKGVYSLMGVKLSNDATTLRQLPAGIYLVNGKKTLVK